MCGVCVWGWVCGGWDVWVWVGVCVGGVEFFCFCFGFILSSQYLSHFQKQIITNEKDVKTGFPLSIHCLLHDLSTFSIKNDKALRLLLTYRNLRNKSKKNYAGLNIAPFKVNRLFVSKTVLLAQIIACNDNRCKVLCLLFHYKLKVQFLVLTLILTVDT